MRQLRVCRQQRALSLFTNLTAVMFLASCADVVEPTHQRIDLRTQAAITKSAGLHRYVIMFKGDVTDVGGVARSLVEAHGGRLRVVFHRIFKGFAADLPPAAAEALRSHPSVSYVEDDAIVNVLAVTQSPTPNWGLDRIDQRYLAMNNSYFYERTGSGVHYYSMDAGLEANHNELVGRVSTGWDIVNPGGDASDCLDPASPSYGHGTHTATIAAGTTYGVAKQMTVHAVKVSDCGVGSPSLFAEGADSIITNLSLPAVVNASLQYLGSATIDSAVVDMIAAGIVVVVAAGNQGYNACNNSPARVPGAITVAAVDHGDRRAGWSNFGSCLDLFAPGVSITAGTPPTPSSTRVYSGTSMAAPHVAGTAGLWLQGFPSSTPAQVASKITTHATWNIVGDPQAGSPNRLLWMRFANMSPTADFEYSCSAGGWCQFYGYPSVDDVGVTQYAWYFTAGYPDQDYGASISHDFYGSGSSEVRLRVTDTEGREHETSKWISY